MNDDNLTIAKAREIFESQPETGTILLNRPQGYWEGLYRDGTYHFRFGYAKRHEGILLTVRGPGIWQQTSAWVWKGDDFEEILGTLYDEACKQPKPDFSEQTTVCPA